MFDFSLAELAVVVVVAAMVIGPKELPVVLRTIGRGLAKARLFARDMNGVLTKMIDESELRETKDAVSAEVHYIRDLEGNLQRTYDLEGLMGETRKAEKEPRA